MSYRNDHEAALLRVDALEAELETLRLAYEQQCANDEAEEPLPKRRSRTAWIVACGALALTAGTAIGALALFRTTSGSVPSTDDSTAVTITRPAIDDLTQLRECRQAITPLTNPRNAETTDPRGMHAAVAPILDTGAPCRALLADADHLEIDPALRGLVRAWSRAEDELIGDITRTMIYYASDPYAADDYRSAPQLWREYDRAISARDAVLRQLAPLL